MDRLINADLARIQAMIDGDKDLLQTLLHEDLSWTHSSGRTDDKASFLTVIESGQTDYKSLRVSNRKITIRESTYIYSGIVEGNAEVNGNEKQLRNIFLSVWIDSTAGLQMLAWQSTAIKQQQKPPKDKRQPAATLEPI